MSDDTIATIEGKATYEKVAVYPKKGSGIRVKGLYDNSETVYEAPWDGVTIGGMKLDLIHDEFTLTPDGNGFIWVEATEDELRITEEEPE